MPVYLITPREAACFPKLYADWPEGARLANASVYLAQGLTIDVYITNPAYQGVLDCRDAAGHERWKIDCRHIVGWREIS